MSHYRDVIVLRCRNTIPTHTEPWPHNCNPNHILIPNSPTLAVIFHIAKLWEYEIYEIVLKRKNLDVGSGCFGDIFRALFFHHVRWILWTDVFEHKLQSFSKLKVIFMLLALKIGFIVIFFFWIQRNCLFLLIFRMLCGHLEAVLGGKIIAWRDVETLICLVFFFFFSPKHER